MPNTSNIVDADEQRVPRRTSSGADRSSERERFDKLMVLAAIVQSIPLFIWAAPLVLLFGFILMALWYNRDGHALHDFTQGVLLWGSRVLIAGGFVLLIIGAWKVYRMFHQAMLDAAARRVAAAGATKAIAGARNAELKNELLEADIELRRQIPNVILGLSQMGVPFRYDAKGNLEVIGHAAGQTVVSQYDPAQLGAGAQTAIAGPMTADGLPTNVLYEQVKGQVPKGHVLVGVGRGGAVETKEKAVGAMVWIVGMSGTGKTSTTVLRVDERVEMGHGLLGVDPHFFKDDSLYHAIYELPDGKPGPYKHAFVKPMARHPKEQKAVLEYFITEFNGRKGGRIPRNQWKPLTLLVDEVGSLMDPTTEEEEEVAKLLPTIARISGQEARNFLMGSIFVSQQATGLAWLRKVALMIIVHQLLMESERKLAVNGDMAVVRAMDTWPVGRTYIFGVGFQEGPRTVQQPFFKPTKVVESDVAPVVIDEHAESFEEDFEDDDPLEAADHPGEETPPPPALAGDMRRVFDACEQLHVLGNRVSSRAVEQITGIDKDKANGLMNRLADMGYIPYWSRKRAV